MQRTMVAVVVAGALAVAAAGCGDDEGGTSAGPEATPATPTTPTSSPGADEDTVYTMDATVLEDTEHGPQLCQVVLTSYPPQCGGPDVREWDWAQAEGAESANGTTWGYYRVVGTWDREAQALTLTEPPTVPPAPGSDGAVGPEPDFSTPCPRPEGGWKPVDPATTNQAALEAVDARARQHPDTAGTWLDQSAEPGWSGLNDPAQLVFNVRTTGDTAALEAELREVWGGALCVSEATRSSQELQAIADEIRTEHAEVEGGTGDVAGANVDESRQMVVVDVYVTDPDLQARFEEDYGAGVVEQLPWLTPVE